MTEIMRQKEDKACAELFNRVREGIQTREDVKTLLSLNCTREEAQQCLGQSDTVYLAPTNFVVNAANALWMRRHTGEKVLYRAIDTFRHADSPAEKAKARKHVAHLYETKGVTQTCGAEPELTLAIGQKVECSSNVDVSDGLVNGAHGVICHLQKRSKVVWVRFEEKNSGLKRRTEIDPAQRLVSLELCELSGEEKLQLTPIYFHHHKFQLGHTRVGE